MMREGLLLLDGESNVCRLVSLDVLLVNTGWEIQPTNDRKHQTDHHRTINDPAPLHKGDGAKVFYR